MIEFRLLEQKDLDEIYELHFHAMREADLVLDQSMLLGIEGETDREDGAFCVAVSNGAVVGIGGLFCVESTRYELRHLFVEKNYRGQLIGSGLLKFIFDAIGVNSETKVCANTLESMHAAQGLLKSAGFKAVGRYKQNDRDYVYYTYG